jgi:hypothetical protein
LLELDCGTVKDDLTRILTWQESRAISKNLTVQFENIVYQIQTERPTYTMRNAAITVCADAKQKITLLYKGKFLPYTVFHKQIKQSEVVIAKDLNKTIKGMNLGASPEPHPPQAAGYVSQKGIKTKPAPIPHKPAPDHPWRVFLISKKSRNVPAARGGDISALENG